MDLGLTLFGFGDDRCVVKQCKAGTAFNLSFESLTSREALHALRDVQKNDTMTWEHIKTAQYKTPKADEEVEPPFPHAADVELDPSDVSVDTVLQHIALGESSVPHGCSADELGNLLVDNESESYEPEEVLDDMTGFNLWLMGIRRLRPRVVASAGMLRTLSSIRQACDGVTNLGAYLYSNLGGSLSTAQVRLYFYSAMAIMQSADAGVSTEEQGQLLLMFTSNEWAVEIYVQSPPPARWSYVKALLESHMAKQM
ncbi:hypothetical protein BDR07DRAFT_1494757 [Suillus spraguei]|nr:hypothetical protein BDR07DRAFT_1494757 [Suillus spraguei]